MSVTCSCRRVGETSQFFRALHLEQFDSPSLHSASLSVRDPSSGWPLLQYLTVPRALRVQRGVLCLGSHFSHGLVASLALDESAAIDSADAGKVSPSFASALSSILTAAHSFTSGSQPSHGVSVFIGLSSRLLSLIGEQSFVDDDGEVTERVPTLSPIYAANDIRDSIPNPRLLIPATDGDILLVVKGGSAESCHRAMCMILLKNVGIVPSARVADSSSTTTTSSSLPALSEQTLSTTFGVLSLTSCRNLAGRDITGFVDGTVNPDHTLRQSLNVAVSLSGSSSVYGAKFIHDLPLFRSLSLDQKCAVIGRNYGQLSSVRSSLDERVENPRSGNPGCRDTRGHIFRSWGDMLRLALPFFDGPEPPNFPDGCPMSTARERPPLTAPLGYPMVHANVAGVEGGASMQQPRSSSSSSSSSRLQPVSTGEEINKTTPGDGSTLQSSSNHHLPVCSSASLNGSVSESGVRAGLYFLAAACDLNEVQEALNRMCGYYAKEFDGGEGSIDNLFSISRAESGAFFFVPSLRELEMFAAKLEGKEAPPEKAEEEKLEEIRVLIGALGTELQDLKPVDDGKQHRKTIKRALRKHDCPNCESPQDCVMEEGSCLFRCTFCGRTQLFDALDGSNIVLLDHFNLNHKKFEHGKVSAFYFDVLGMALDDRRRANFDKGRGSLWANAGANQIHLSEADQPQVFDGVIHLVYGSATALEALQSRCLSLGVHFTAEVVDDSCTKVTLKCPYGNTFCCGVGKGDPRGRQPASTLTVAKVKSEDSCEAVAVLEFWVKDKVDLPGIARFYSKGFGAKTIMTSEESLEVAFGPFQTVRFRVGEVAAVNDEYADGFGPHISLYVKSLRACWKEMESLGLTYISPRFDRTSRTVEEAIENMTFRTLKIVDPEDGRFIMRLEHEISAVAGRTGDKNGFFPFMACWG